MMFAVTGDITKEEAVNKITAIFRQMEQLPARP